MSINMKLIAIALFSSLLHFTVHASALADDSNPPIAGGVPFFYYDDFDTAVDWYKNKLGLTPMTEEDWVAIFELTPTSYIGLVDVEGGSLGVAEEKGAMLSIDTPDLDAWYEKLQGIEGVNITQGIQAGAEGMVRVFKVEDPGGYIIEFFQWQEDRKEAKRYAK